MLTGPPPRFRALVAGAASRPTLSRSLLNAPRLRGRALALIWHRVRPHDAGLADVVPTVTVERFREQLELLKEIVDIVPLSELDRRDPRRRPAVALTFDDDDHGHAANALPVLTALDLTATFFLSGRWLHGRGPYWWELVERRIEAVGVDVAAEEFGVEAATAEELAGRVEGTAAVERLAPLERQGEPPMSRADARQLVSAGMEIGFHTVEHPPLPTLGDSAIGRAVGWGREELASDLDTSIERFAYPHGRHDERVRRAVVAQGYASAWTSSHAAAQPGDDPAARGRWEPRDRPPGDVAVGMIRRLAGG